MSYFRELPDIEYQSQLPTKNSSLNYVRVKNLFRRVKLRDDLQNVFTLFNKYQIDEGERPDTIAERIYGSSDLDWVILLSANIINVRNEWPLSNRDLYQFVEDKYGLDRMNEIKYYQTTEVKNSKGYLILPAGKVVDSDFTIPDPDNPHISLNPVVGISNYDYEIDKNNQKRTIYILKPQYLQQYLNDIRSIMYYEKSSQYINTKLIRTENTLNTNP
jgi:hypothetical protein